MNVLDNVRIGINMNIIYTLKKHIFTFIGDIKWSGILHPFWFTVNASGYKLRGKHYRAVISLLKPGDILLRRFEGYIDKWFIPGWWNHAGIYIGNEQIVHAVSEGVLQEDLLDFMRTDHMMILRSKYSFPNDAVKRALSVVGSPYDFDFDFTQTNRFSCTELASYCHNLIDIKSHRRWNALWKKVLVADDFVGCPELEIIWDSREFN